ncbi:MAG: hypothetical protein IJU84_05655 [Clostridia bacterium]|nr:hypothetical protein [Clostridia bacterium]
MKKKITSLLVIVALALGTLALAGCSWFEANTISFVNPPATTYILGETANLEFTIEVNGVNYEYSKNAELITVENFSTSSVGTKTATVTYDNKFKLQFTYTVLDGRYAGGSGTETDPYLVSTREQFQNLLDETSFKYYKLTRSIDFAGFALRQANAGTGKSDKRDDNDTNYQNRVWTGYIDGSGYALLHIGKVFTSKGEPQDKYGELFGNIGSKTGSFVMKNITIDYASTGDSACNGLAYGNGKDATILFENVKFTGYIDASSSSSTVVSAALNYAGRNKIDGKTQAFKSVTFRNCENSVNILNSYNANYVAGYFAGNNGIYDSTVSFENCTFDGIIEGAVSYQGAFAVQDKNADGKTTFKTSFANQFTFSNCRILENAKLYVSTNGVSNTGAIRIVGYDGTSVTGVTAVKADFVDSTTLQSLTVSAPTSTTKVTTVINVSGVEYHHLKIFVCGSMKHDDREGKPSGTFRFLHPTPEKGTDGSYQLYKIKYVAGEVPSNANALEKGFANSRFNVVEDTANYYGEGTCTGVDMSNCTVIVVAYDNTGRAIAIGRYKGNGSAAKPNVNLN